MSSEVSDPTAPSISFAAAADEAVLGCGLTQAAGPSVPVALADICARGNNARRPSTVAATSGPLCC